MVEAVTVGRSQIVAPLSPLLSRVWYLSSLKSRSCGEFPAKVMIPEIIQKGGRGGIAPFWVILQPKSERPTPRRNQAPNFIFGTFKPFPLGTRYSVLHLP